MQILNNTEYKELKELIKINSLDVTFINYGGFIKEYNILSHHPEHRKNRKKLIGLYRLCVGSLIYQITGDEYDVYLNEEQKNDFELFLNETKETEKYKSNFKDAFNSYTYELIIYSPKYLDYMGRNWYKLIENDLKLPLNASKERDTNLYNDVLKEAKRIEKHFKSKGFEFEGYEINKVYKDIHYTSEEYQELCNICKGSSGIGDHHPTHQSYRGTKEQFKSSLQKFKELTLKSTGRKMLIDIHTYGFRYIEIDPVIK